MELIGTSFMEAKENKETYKAVVRCHIGLYLELLLEASVEADSMFILQGFFPVFINPKVYALVIPDARLTRGRFVVEECPDLILPPMHPAPEGMSGTEGMPGPEEYPGLEERMGGASELPPTH